MADTKTIAIFGAGTGLGASLATRFGREGYRVALVARWPAPLDERVAELGRASIEAAAFPADLTNLDGIPALVRSIEARFGSIDVAVYQPVGHVGFVPAVDLDAAKLQPMATIFTFSPIEVSHAVLPGMLARGDGAIVIVGGLTAVAPMEWCRPHDGGSAQLHFLAQCRSSAQGRLRRRGEHRRRHRWLGRISRHDVGWRDTRSEVSADQPR